jgi:predicted protein tyrosine phosphatase
MPRAEIRVLSRQAAEQYQPQSVEVCISISDPEAAPAQLSGAFAAVLRLAFNDIAAAAAQGPGDILFTTEHAGAILQFVSGWVDAQRLVIHCNAGASRSPAIALGLCDIFGWPTEELEAAFPNWNPWVRRLISQQLAPPHSPGR